MIPAVVLLRGGMEAGGGGKGRHTGGPRPLLWLSNGEEAHLQGVRNMLARAGMTEAPLECGPNFPMVRIGAEQLLRSGEVPAPIQNYCSGKHAGMLTLARGKGWNPKGYRLPGHPAPERMREEAAGWSGFPVDRIRLGVDGCGVPCFGLPLRAAAREDGARRACEVALVSVLSALGVFSPEERDRLAPWIRHPVPNTRGEEEPWLEVARGERSAQPALEEA